MKFFEVQKCEKSQMCKITIKEITLRTIGVQQQKNPVTTPHSIRKIKLAKPLQKYQNK